MVIFLIIADTVVLTEGLVETGMLDIRVVDCTLDADVVELAIVVAMIELVVVDGNRAAAAAVVVVVVDETDASDEGTNDATVEFITLSGPLRIVAVASDTFAAK